MNLRDLDLELTKIYRHLLEFDSTAMELAKDVHPEFRLSAINLLRYLLLRTHDLREIHDCLSEYGISSLRSAEGYTLKNVVDVLRLVKLLQGETWAPERDLLLLGYQKSKELRHQHANVLFNEKDRKCFTEIMVTMPTEAAHDEQLVENLLLEGMEVARINLSHDHETVWRQIAANIRKQSESLQIPCRIVVDLGGPKIRSKEIVVRHKGKKMLAEGIKVQDGDKILLIADGADLKSLPICKKKGSKLFGITVNLPSVLSDMQIGDRIFFDDGKLRAQVVKKAGDNVEVKIDHGARHGCRLKTGKGINLPDTMLHLESLTKEDIAYLPVAMELADIIGYSFVRNAKDVTVLYDLLGDRLESTGIMLKIENQEAFRNLPLILLEAMKCRRLGVMIARGDLAVEIGPERMSEIQDEIMWVCEAAHIPVVWATEVLDRLTKKGRTTRSEITDAAFSVRAECVMLNKGPFIVEAVRLLKDILIKMEEHTSKKKSKMRPLHLAIEALQKINAQQIKKGLYQPANE
jgi:pyruvate kinase